MDSAPGAITNHCDDMPTPALKAAMRLTQLYRGTGDGTMAGQWVIVAGRLILIVNGKTEDLGAWESAPPTTSGAPPPP